jgi:hypothetical protein
MSRDVFKNFFNLRFGPSFEKTIQLNVTHEVDLLDDVVGKAG